MDDESTLFIRRPPSGAVTYAIRTKLVDRVYVHVLPTLFLFASRIQCSSFHGAFKRQYIGLKTKQRGCAHYLGDTCIRGGRGRMAGRPSGSHSPPVSLPSISSLAPAILLVFSAQCRVIMELLRRRMPLGPPTD